MSFQRRRWWRWDTMGFRYTVGTAFCIANQKQRYLSSSEL